MNKEPIIGLLMMLKNEEQRLQVTLDSIKGLEHIIVFDTGSTDSTIDILTKFSKENDMQLHIKRGDFEDFATSRNISLKFAYKISREHNIDFLLLLDCNDVLQTPQTLKEYCKTQLETFDTAFLLHQKWITGFDEHKQEIALDYFNVRLIKPNYDWYYKQSVHEYFHNDLYEEANTAPHSSLIIFQDRTKDDNKTSKRVFRDIKFLLDEYSQNPHDTRVLYYLAQTYDCMEDKRNAYKYYSRRAKLDGFLEEKFMSAYKCGLIAHDILKKWDDAISWFMRALEVFIRAEPLVMLAKCYLSKTKYVLAEMYSNTATLLPYPTDAILFVDTYCYDYSRYAVHCQSAYYCGKIYEGQKTAIKAYNYSKNARDKTNLDFYEKAVFVSENLPPKTKTPLVEIITNAVSFDTIYEMLKKKKSKS